MPRIMKVGASKPSGVYIRAAVDLLGSIGDETPATSPKAGDPDVGNTLSMSSGDVDSDVDLRLIALGNAIPTAVKVALACQQQDLAFIHSIQTSYDPATRRTQIVIELMKGGNVEEATAKNEVRRLSAKEDLSRRRSNRVMKTLDPSAFRPHRADSTGDGDDGDERDQESPNSSPKAAAQEGDSRPSFSRLPTVAMDFAAKPAVSLADKVQQDFDNADLVEPTAEYTVHNSMINAFGGLRYGEKFCNDKRAVVRTELQKELIEDDDVYTWSGPPTLKGVSAVSVVCQKGQKRADDPTPNQDNYFVSHVGDVAIYAAVDGHGPFGHLVSFRVVQALQYNIVKSPHFGGDWSRCLRESFEKTQEAVVALSTDHNVNLEASGAAASVVVFEGPRVHIAHIGDARVMIGAWSKNDSRLIFATEDHKPGNPEEKARIVGAGMEVRDDGEGGTRIYLPGERFPGLTMSRAFGDTASKGVTQEPDYKMLEVGENSETFAILASDGIWEFMQPKDMVEFTTKKLRLRGPSGTASYLVDLSRKLWAHHSGEYCDDITAVVVMRNMPRKGTTGDHRLFIRPFREASDGKDGS